ncbi:unnamed protein product [Cylindrotheca closterium]|uniref:Uncharacterized protein n=1 Tax=Cylindrotheca closterium TaxID=2856 RepID=A0AAD2G9Q5_9STRA|nr:unnamed protein product [Cylindrotheca closterium]
MPSKSSTQGDAHRHRRHDSRSSSSRHGSSSQDLGPERHASQTRSSSERRVSVKREGSVRSKGHSGRSSSRSASVPHNGGSAFAYGPSGQQQKRLVVVDSTDSDSEEVSNELSESSTTSPHSSMKSTSLFGIGAFTVGVIIAVVTTYMLMKGGNTDSKSINSNNGAAPLVQVVPTMDPTFSPTGMPTVEYPAPELAVCEALSDGKDVRTTTASDLLPRNMDISFDVTVRPGGNFRTEDELFAFFPEKIESVLVPILAGCDDVKGFQRKLNSNYEQGSLLRRELGELEQIRYVIAGGRVSGTKTNEVECAASTSGQLLSCFNVVIYFEFYLKGDERVFQVMSLITSMLNELTTREDVASNGILTPSMVKSLGLPNPPFQNVVVRGIQNNDPTVSPSVSPTQFPTDRPSSSPSRAPTGMPSIAPSGAPSSSPSSSPSGKPSMAPTKGPTKAPTPQPTRAPTAKPSAFPTGMPSAIPTAAPSAKPSMVPSTMPSLSSAPSLSSEPSLAPSISNAPTSRMSFIIGMLPPNYNNMTAIEWLSYNDTWMPLTDNDEGVWADRYAMFQSFQNFAQIGRSACLWTGVTCDANERITKVSLPSNGLTNGIPSELSKLTELRSLNLTQNTYTGTTIPTELFGLSKLENLDISNSGINGTIPTQIVNMAALRELHINSNNLVGTIPRMPELVTRSPDDVITLGSGATVSCVCEMYGNQLEVNTVSTAHAGGCDLVRTASDSSSSSSSSSSDDNSSSTSAPATRYRYRSLFERGGFRALDEESSSEDEDHEQQDMNTIRSPVYDVVGVRTPRAAKKIKHVLVKKHKKRAKRGKKHNMSNREEDLINAEFQKSEFYDEEE